MELLHSLSILGDGDDDDDNTLTDDKNDEHFVSGDEDSLDFEEGAGEEGDDEKNPFDDMGDDF